MQTKFDELAYLKLYSNLLPIYFAQKRECAKASKQSSSVVCLMVVSVRMEPCSAKQSLSNDVILCFQVGKYCGLFAAACKIKRFIHCKVCSTKVGSHGPQNVLENPFQCNFNYGGVNYF